MLDRTPVPHTLVATLGRDLLPWVLVAVGGSSSSWQQQQGVVVAPAAPAVAAGVEQAPAEVEGPVVVGAERLSRPSGTMSLARWKPWHG